MRSGGREEKRVMIRRPCLVDLNNNASFLTPLSTLLVGPPSRRGRPSLLAQPSLLAARARTATTKPLHLTSGAGEEPPLPGTRGASSFPFRLALWAFRKRRASTHIDETNINVNWFYYTAKATENGLATKNLFTQPRTAPVPTGRPSGGASSPARVVSLLSAAPPSGTRPHSSRRAPRRLPPASRKSKKNHRRKLCRPSARRCRPRPRPHSSKPFPLTFQTEPIRRFQPFLDPSKGRSRPRGPPGLRGRRWRGARRGWILLGFGWL